MRTLSLALLVVSAPFAATEALAQPAVAYGADVGVARPVGGTPPVYRTAVASTVGTVGSVLGGAAPALVYLVVSAPGLGTGSSGDTEFSPGLAVAMAAGATLGTAAFVYVIGGDEAGYQGILPYPDLRKSDARPALVGAALAFLPGLGAALLIQQALPPDTDPFLTYLAVPVAQGLGAAVAISLSR